MIEILQGTKETVPFQKGSSVMLYDNDKYEDYPTHWHMPIEIIMPLENSYHVNCNHIDYFMKEGDILIICPAVLHTINAPIKGRRYIFQAAFQPIRDIQGIDSIFSLLAPAVFISLENAPTIHGNIQKLIYEIADTYKNCSFLRDATIYTKLLEILLLIGNDFALRNAAPAQRTTKQQEYTEKFMFICDYINAHFAEDLSLDFIADLAGFSKFHFSRLFKQFTEISFYQYLNKRRIMNAETLLVDPQHSITDIALRCGFSSLSAFIRMFKIHKGCTPSEFKNMYTYGNHE